MTEAAAVSLGLQEQAPQLQGASPSPEQAWGVASSLCVSLPASRSPQHLEDLRAPSRDQVDGFSVTTQVSKKGSLSQHCPGPILGVVSVVNNFPLTFFM